MSKHLSKTFPNSIGATNNFYLFHDSLTRSRSLPLSLSHIISHCLFRLAVTKVAMEISVRLRYIAFKWSTMRNLALTYGQKWRKNHSNFASKGYAMCVCVFVRVCCGRGVTTIMTMATTTRANLKCFLEKTSIRCLPNC